MKMKRCVIKIGGVLLEDGEQLERLCRKFAAIKTPFVLVHGGGVFAGQLAKQLGIPCRMVDGRRVTDDNMLRVTVMAYAGWVNKILVARLQSFGVNACGLSGCDMDMVRAERRVQEGLEWGHVGDVARVNTGMLEALLDQDIVPVLSPITCDGQGGLLNSNADGIAAAVAKALARLGEVELIYCFDKRGVLADVNDDKTVIPGLTPVMYKALRREKLIHEGMIPKLDYAFSTIQAGVKSVRLLHPDELDNPVAGTRITGEE
ncbi:MULTISPECIES: acetylglutamate kinase [Butyricimonas]|uniref:acetylglutamate kinase n=1 Tax=Butyricimonas TaxID=574697 RepID=UPI00350EF528